MFFEINNSTGKDVGNVYPQVRCLLNEEDMNLFLMEDFPSYSNTIRFKKEDGMKLTDVISQSGIVGKGFLISQKLKDILEECSIMNHKYYKASINGEEGVFYWIVICQDLTSVIDYTNSTFFETKFSSKKGHISLTSHAEFVKLKEENGKFWGAKFDKTVLMRDSEISNFDLFSLVPFYHRFVITTKLYNFLVSNNITGLDYTEIYLELK